MGCSDEHRNNTRRVRASWKCETKEYRGFQRDLAISNSVVCYGHALNRLTATEINAKGFDAKGTLIGKKSLPYIGASAVHEALCGAPQLSDASITTVIPCVVLPFRNCG